MTEDKVKKPEPIMLPLLIGLSGYPKSGKNHLAYTFPAPIAVIEFDIGGSKPVLTKFKDKQIDIFPYPLPIIDSDPPKPYAKEVWKAVDAKLTELFAARKYRTYVIDTATQLWAVIRHYVAEEKHQQKLLEVQYTLPNLLMGSIWTRARYSGANLVTLQYLRDKYVKGENTGEVELDGWGRTEAAADIALWIAAKTVKVQGGNTNVNITTIRANKFERDLNGMEIEDATYSDLITLLGV